MDEHTEPKPTTADLAGSGPAKPPAAEPQGEMNAKATNLEAKTQDEETKAPLFTGEEAGKLSERWDVVQVGFVDEPRKAVEDADSLVAETMKRLAERFADERARLESQWDRGDEVSTEDLRQALRRYRAFFGRLLAV